MKKINNRLNRLISFEYSILFRLVEVHSLYKTDFTVFFISS